MTIPTYTHLWSWMTCAAHEARLLGHFEIDLDHLLLGLLAQGGDAAALLGAHGVTLTSARNATRELADADLAGIGINSAAIWDAVLPSDSAAQITAELGEIPLSARARQLTGVRTNNFRTPLTTLHALMEADSDIPTRLLTHLDVDIAQLRIDLTAHIERDAKPRADRASVVAVDRNLLPYGPAAALRMSRFISAPPGLVHTVITDATVLANWAISSEELHEELADGIVSRHRSRNGRIHFDLRWNQVAHGTEAVCWVKTLLNGPYDGQAHSYDRFQLRAASGGCWLDFTRAYRKWRLSGRLAHPVTRRLTRIGMVSTLGSIARAVAASS